MIMKGQNKTPGKTIQNKDREEKMIQDLGEKMEAKIEKMQEMFTKDQEELKNKRTNKRR